VTRRALRLAELRRRLALLPDVEVFALTRAGLAPEVVVERLERLVAERPPVRARVVLGLGLRERPAVALPILD
jgi:hypothetical protein